jgi:hypothetical protein
MQTGNEPLYQVLLLETDSRRAGAVLKVLAGRNLRGTVAADFQTLRSVLDLHRWSFWMRLFRRIRARRMVSVCLARCEPTTRNCRW